MWSPIFSSKLMAAGGSIERQTDARWRALGALLGCGVARYAGALWPMVNRVSTVSGLAKPGDIRSNAQTLAPEAE